MSWPVIYLVVKKLSMVVTPSMILAGTAFHSNQKVMKDEVTSVISGINTVVK